MKLLRRVKNRMVQELNLLFIHKVIHWFYRRNETCSDETKETDLGNYAVSQYIQTYDDNLCAEQK